MTWTLLTNDDGIDSPAPLPFAEGLSVHDEVRVVVPDRERQLDLQSITRFDPLHGSDVDAAHHGWVAMTPLRLPESVPVPDGVRRWLERS